MKLNMKLYLFMLCALFGASGVFAQANDNFKQVAPPDNAKDLIKKMESTQAPKSTEGQEVKLEATNAATSVTAAPQRNEDLPPEKRTRIRKGFDAKTKQTVFREVVTQEQLDARNKPKQGPEQRAVVPPGKE
jgi:hypothetical protein